MENAKTLLMNHFRKWVTGQVTVLLAVLLVLSLSSCGVEPPEERLRTRLGDMQTAMVERRPGDFMEGVAEDFTGNTGMDRAALQALLRVQMLRNSRIGVMTGPLDIAISGDRATVRFSAVLTGGDGGLLPERARAYQVTSGWREERGQWLLYYAAWESDI